MKAKKLLALAAAILAAGAVCPVDSFVCEEEGQCVYSGKPSHQRVIFARSY